MPTPNKIIGFWQEIPLYGKTDHYAKINRSSLFTYRALGPVPTAYLLYLREANYIAGHRGLLENPLDPGRPILGGASILTDGEWIWTLDVAFFVEHHGIGLPETFLQTIEANNYEAPNMSYQENVAFSEAFLKWTKS